MGQMLWETAQFFPMTRDTCVARALKQTVAGRQKLDMCNWEVERRLNSFSHVHLHVMSSDVSSWASFVVGLPLPWNVTFPFFFHRSWAFSVFGPSTGEYDGPRLLPMEQLSRLHGSRPPDISIFSPNYRPVFRSVLLYSSVSIFFRVNSLFAARFKLCVN